MRRLLCAVVLLIATTACGMNVRAEDVGAVQFTTPSTDDGADTLAHAAAICAAHVTNMCATIPATTCQYESGWAVPCGKIDYALRTSVPIPQQFKSDSTQQNDMSTVQGMAQGLPAPPQ